MPSASNKLEKQASIGSVHGTGGGNNGTGGGATKKSQDVINSNSNAVPENNTTITSLNNNIANSTTNEGSVTSTSTNTKGVTANPVLEANIPMKQTITTIDHKIRNLEKRKVSAVYSISYIFLFLWQKSRRIHKEAPVSKSSRSKCMYGWLEQSRRHLTKPAA